MRIVVLVKHVPSRSAKPSFTRDHTTDRTGVEGGLSEPDRYAVEQALRLAEAIVGSEVTYLTMGPPPAVEAVHAALALGGDRAVHVGDDALHGSDAPATSLVLAGAIERIGFDIVLCGAASTDGGTSLVPAMLAERLGVALLTFADELTVADGLVRIRRSEDDASLEIEAPLPAVISVTAETGPVRYPLLRRIMTVRSHSIETWGLADLGIGGENVGLAAAWTRVERVESVPPRSGAIMSNDVDGAARLAEFLADRHLM